MGMTTIAYKGYLIRASYSAQWIEKDGITIAHLALDVPLSDAYRIIDELTAEAK